MNDLNNIISILELSYPDVEFRLHSFSGLISAKISINKIHEYVYLELTQKPDLKLSSQYEENWLKSKKWICYNKSYLQELGFGTRCGGEDPFEVFDEAINSLHYKLNRIIELAKVSEVFLQKTNKVSQSQS